MEERDRDPNYNYSRDWHDKPQAGPSGIASTTSSLSQRRRSSAAHTRPSLPPPSQPIPSVPEFPTTNGHASYVQNSNYHHSQDMESPPQPSSYLNGNHTSSFNRQAASPSLAAVAAFSHYSPSQPQQPSASSSVDDLSDPPPPSILPPSSSRIQTADELDTQHLLPPTTTEARPPSSRRALTRALELAREAVQLDSSNDDPQAAVMAYGRSVALLSEVMERVRRGEDTTEPRRRNGRRRNSVAQEEEVRRLQRIVSFALSQATPPHLSTQHDTYADRMNILSIVYSIPPIPYSTASVYSSTTASSESTACNSPSNSPISETSDLIPSVTYTNHTQDDHFDTPHDPPESTGRSSDGMEAIGAAMFTDLASPTTPGLLPSAHPYAAPQYDLPTPQASNSLPASQNRASVQVRRSRASSAALPPALPPPANSPPPAPDAAESSSIIQGSKQHLDVVTRQRGDSVGHRRTGSGSKLMPLEEEAERYEDFPDVADFEMRAGARTTVMDARNESPPLPPLPSPTNDTNGPPGTPKNASSMKTSTSPRATTNMIVPRPRGSSQTSSPRVEPVVINASITQGTISQRRLKSSAPPTPRSSSPSESIASVGSHPRSVASSLPGNSGASLTGVARSRSSSQPGRRPSLVGGRISPPGERPPLPTIVSSNGVPQRKTSYPSKLNPFNQTIQLTVQTDLPPSTFSPPLMAQQPSFTSVIPITPVSPLPPAAPTDPLRKPYHLMNLLRTTMTSTTGGYVTRRLHVPQEVWSQGGAKLNNLPEKVRVVGILCSALEDLQNSSSEHFGAGNVSSGMALGIGSIGRKEGEAWISKLEDFSTVCDGVVANFGKKLGVGEGFVLKKTTWGDKLGRRFDKYINGKKYVMFSIQMLSSNLFFQFGFTRRVRARSAKTLSSCPAARRAYEGYQLFPRRARILCVSRRRSACCGPQVEALLGILRHRGVDICYPRFVAATGQVCQEVRKVAGRINTDGHPQSQFRSFVFCFYFLAAESSRSLRLIPFRIGMLDPCACAFVLLENMLNSCGDIVCIFYVDSLSRHSNCFYHFYFIHSVFWPSSQYMERNEYSWK